MKNSLLLKIFFFSILIIILSCEMISQVISFSGYNSRTLKQIKLDSIYINNFTTNRDTMLVNRDTIDLSNLTDVSDIIIVMNKSIQISQCSPSCFESSTQFSIYNPKYSFIKIIVSNSLGSTVAEYENFMTEGEHNFTFDGSILQQGIYFITLISCSSTQTIKAIKYGKTTNNNCSIIYHGESSKLINEVFSEGDLYSFNGYARGYKVPLMAELVTIQDGENIQLYLESLSNFDFTKVDVEISNIIGIFWNIRGGDGQKTIVYYDTTDIEMSFSFIDSLPGYNNLKYGIGTEYIDCRKINSIGDTIGICNEVIIEGVFVDNWMSSSIFIKSIYDTIHKVLKNIEFATSYKRSIFENNYSSDNYHGIRFNLKEMSCYYDENFNLICIKILKKEDMDLTEGYGVLNGMSYHHWGRKLISIIYKDDFPNLYIKFLK